MPYALFRISLVPRRQGSLFGEAPERAEPENEASLKADWVRLLFSEPSEVRHYGNTLYLVPRFNLTDFVGGYISKRTNVRIRPSPMPDSDTEAVADYPRANYFLSMSRDESSQVIALERKRLVGQPVAVIRALEEHFNDRVLMDTNYEAVILPIAAKGDYETAAREYEGRITEVSFLFVVPNIDFMWTELRDYLAEARDKEGAQEVEHAVRNRDGNVNAKADRLTTFARLAERGFGRALIKSFKKIVYRSDDRVQTVDIPEKTAINDMDESGFRATAQGLFDRWER